MKIQIITQSTPINGYTHINPELGGNIQDIPCENNECVEIIADKICDYLPRNQLFKTLEYYLTKLRIGGKIVIGGTEVRELAKNLVLNDNYEEFNHLLFGRYDSPWSIKTGISSVIEISDFLASMGLKIIKKRIDRCTFIVEAHRE
jgi:hypothetical protein